MRLAASLATVCLAASAASVTASPLEDPTLGGSVFSGPTHPHPTSIYINPAALALASSGVHFFFRSSLRVDRIRIARREIDPDTGATVDGQSVKNTPVVPGGFVAYHQTFDKVAVGIALYTPQSEELITGVKELRYHTLDGDHYQYAATVSVAWRPTSRLIAGAGLSLMGSTMEMSFARDTALEAGSDSTRGINSDCNGSPCGIENPAASERYDLEIATEGAKPFAIFDFLSTKNIALTAGIAIDLGAGWWFGASYASPPGLLSPLSLPGTVTVTPAPRDGGDPRTGEAEVVFNLPQTVHVGVRGPLSWIPDHEIVADVRWQNLSRHTEYDVRMFGGDLSEGDIPPWYPRYRGFENVWRVQVGLERQRPVRRIRWGGRLRFETAATPTEDVAPHQIAGTNLSAIVGAELEISDRIMIGAGYGITWYPKVDVKDSAFDPLARLRCVDQQLDLDACEAAGAGRAVPTAAGVYRRLQHAFTVALRLRL
jgi:hypothetical protein